VQRMICRFSMNVRKGTCIKSGCTVSNKRGGKRKERREEEEGDIIEPFDKRPRLYHKDTILPC